MKVKGRIIDAVDVFWPILESEQWKGTPDKIYKSKRIAKSAAERLAKKLNLEIEWEE